MVGEEGREGNWVFWWVREGLKVVRGSKVL